MVDSMWGVGDPALIDRIYEAAIAGDTWGAVLEALAVAMGAIGGLLIAARER